MSSASDRKLNSTCNLLHFFRLILQTRWRETIAANGGTMRANS